MRDISFTNNFRCRICKETGDFYNEIVAPCNCKGGLKNIHLKCLENIVKQKKKLICELCNSQYTKKIKKHLLKKKLITSKYTITNICLTLILIVKIIIIITFIIYLSINNNINILLATNNNIIEYIFFGFILLILIVSYFLKDTGNIILTKIKNKMILRNEVIYDNNIIIKK